MFTFVLMMKKRTFDAQLNLVTAVDGDDVDIMYDILEQSVADDSLDEFDFICYAFLQGSLVEVSLYDREEEDFKVLMRYEEE